MLRVLFLFFVLVFALPVTAQDTGGEISTDQAGPTDYQIDLKLRELFSAADELSEVRASTDAGMVTLTGSVKDVSDAARAVELAGRVEGVVSVEEEIQIVATVNERLTTIMDRFMARIDQMLVLLPLMIVAAIAFAAITALGLWIARRDWPWARIAPNAFIADLLRQVVRLLFVGLALVLALDILGATAVLSTVLGAAGIVGLAVGFAVRDTVENYIASILLSIRQPFKPNDFVKIGDQSGTVVMLTSRATVLISVDGNHIRIPNSTVFKGVIVNYTRNPDRRFSFTLGIDAEASITDALETGLKVLGGLDFVMEAPGPDAWVEEIGDSTVNITYVGWIDQRETSFLKARSEAVRLIKLALESSGIGLPEPGYRINLQGIAGAPAIGIAETEATPKTPPKAPDADELQARDTHAEDEILTKAEEAREAAGEDNLLSDGAMQELGGRRTKPD